MVFVILICAAGIALGVFSFYEQKLFLGFMVTCLIIAGVFGRLLPLFGGSVASMTSPTGQSQGIVQDTLNLFAAIYAAMPEWAQLSVWLFPVWVLLGRVLTWGYYAVIPNSGVRHTEAEKRAHTMAKFSYKQDRQGR